KDCVREPAHLDAALGYYRTFFDAQRFMTPGMIEEQSNTWGKPITQRVLYMHGSQDGLFPLDAETLKRMPALIGPRAEAVMVDGVDVEAGGGEDPAVVGAARPRPVLVDGALALDEHRAVPLLVVAEQDVAAGPARSGEEQLRRDVGQGVGLAGFDVDELRRRAAGCA